ncbi:MAG: helix-turn-helix domain-containing protein [Bacteroides sp.]
MKIFYQNRSEEYCARFTVNNTYPSHLHRQVEMIYVTKGRINVTIDDSSYTLQSGDLSIAFPNHSHSTQSIGNSAAILIIFNPEFADGYLNELTRKKPDVPFIAKSKLPVEVTFAIKNMTDCYAAKKDHRIAQGYLHVILGNILPELDLQLADTGDSVDTCRQIIEYVANHFMNEISLDTMAHDLGLSKYYISHIFSDRIKSSFPAYLGRCRAEHAARLLKTSQMSVTDIGFASGFNSSRTFYRAFREVYGMTPQEYRNV